MQTYPYHYHIKGAAAKWNLLLLVPMITEVFDVLASIYFSCLESETKVIQKSRKPSRLYYSGCEFPRRLGFPRIWLALLGNSGKIWEVRFQLSSLWLYNNYVLLGFDFLETSSHIRMGFKLTTCCHIHDSDCLAFCLTLINKYHKSRKSAKSRRSSIPVEFKYLKS